MGRVGRGDRRLGKIPERSQKKAQGGATPRASLLLTLTSFLAVKASKAANCVLQDPLRAEEKSVLLPSTCLRQLLVWPVSWDLDKGNVALDS